MSTALVSLSVLILHMGAVDEEDDGFPVDDVDGECEPEMSMCGGGLRTMCIRRS